MSPEVLNQILETATAIFKFFGISLPDIIAQLQPVLETIIALFA